MYIYAENYFNILSEVTVYLLKQWRGNLFQKGHQIETTTPTVNLSSQEVSLV